mmetsp:Transcript_11694/g.17351  ORF Transcript_11694/g.17351 Transcript_11694/m.17351 type:complete len:305 (+) Transcript_11694:688-1602(+)
MVSEHLIGGPTLPPSFFTYGDCTFAPPHVSVSPYPCKTGTPSTACTNFCVSGFNGAPPDTTTRMPLIPSFALILLKTREFHHGVSFPFACFLIFAASAVLKSHFLMPPPKSTLYSSPFFIVSHTLGTPAISVGDTALKSPHGFALSSTSVLGDPYPTFAPLKYMVDSATNSNICASGKYAKYTSLFDMPIPSPNAAAAATKFLCSTITPFGSPVDPDVYIITAKSSGFTSSKSVSVSTFFKSCSKTNVVKCFVLCSPPTTIKFFNVGTSSLISSKFFTNDLCTTIVVNSHWFITCTSDSNPKFA